MSPVIWSPTATGDIETIVCVQHKFTKLYPVCNALHTLNVSNA